jgi:hypothetical protein
MNMTMTDTHVNEYWFKSGEVKTASYRQSVSSPQSDLAVGHHCLSPRPSVESCRVGSIVLTGERTINDDLSASYIIIAFLGYPDFHATDTNRSPVLVLQHRYQENVLPFARI